MTRVVMASPAVRDPNRAKALRILGDGRLTVLSLTRSIRTSALVGAVVQVLSSRPGAGSYAVDFTTEEGPEGVFRCTCRKDDGRPVWVGHPVGCAHIRAAQLVLGHGVLPS